MPSDVTEAREAALMWESAQLPMSAIGQPQQGAENPDERTNRVARGPKLGRWGIQTRVDWSRVRREDPSSPTLPARTVPERGCYSPPGSRLLGSARGREGDSLKQPRLQ